MIRGILFLVCLSVCFFCLSVCLSVCLLSTLTFAITFELKRGGDFIFGMHTPPMKPFQMTPRSMTLWPWLWPWSLNSLLDFVANRGIVFNKHTMIFSAPEPKAQVHYCDHVFVCRPSSVCPSVVNFSHFRLLFWNRWTEFNKTWQKARSQCPLPSLRFGPIGKTKWPPWPLIG